MPEIRPHFLQRYVIHPATALLFAMATWRCISRFELIEFAYSAEIAAILVATGYLLLSVRYEKLLSAIFFSFSIVVAYKAWQIAERPSINPNPEQVFIQKLHVAATQILLYQNSTQHLPQSKIEWEKIPLPSQLEKTSLCTVSECKTQGSLVPKEGSHFWFWATPPSSDDKDKKLWYIDGSYMVYTLSDQQNFDLITN